MFILGLGATLFGLTMGWIVYRILRLRAGIGGLSDLMALLGAIGGAAVLAFFGSGVLFGWYAVGLALGFFAYVALGVVLYGKGEVQPWQSVPTAPASTQPDTHPENG